MADYEYDDDMAAEGMDTLSGGEEAYPDDDSLNENFENGSESLDQDSSDDNTVEDNGSIEDDGPSEDDSPMEDKSQDSDSPAEELDIHGSESVVDDSDNTSDSEPGDASDDSLGDSTNEEGTEDISEDDSDDIPEDGTDSLSESDSEDDSRDVESASCHDEELDVGTDNNESLEGTMISIAEYEDKSINATSHNTTYQSTNNHTTHQAINNYVNTQSYESSVNHLSATNSTKRQSNKKSLKKLSVENSSNNQSGCKSSKRQKAPNSQPTGGNVKKRSKNNEIDLESQISNVKRQPKNNSASRRSTKNKARTHLNNINLTSLSINDSQTNNHGSEASLNKPTSYQSHSTSYLGTSDHTESNHSPNAQTHTTTKEINAINESRKDLYATGSTRLIERMTAAALARHEALFDATTSDKAMLVGCAIYAVGISLDPVGAGKLEQMGMQFYKRKGMVKMWTRMEAVSC
jgi:hypothetical protein